MKLYDDEMEAMKEYFAENSGLVFACCLDLWKSRAGDHYLGVVVLFITEDWRLMNVCLSVKHITDRHTARLIYEMTTEVLDNFGILPKCFCADNASNQVLCNDLLADWSDASGVGILLTASLTAALSPNEALSALPKTIVMLRTTFARSTLTRPFWRGYAPLTVSLSTLPHSN